MPTPEEWIKEAVPLKDLGIATKGFSSTVRRSVKGLEPDKVAKRTHVEHTVTYYGKPKQGDTTLHTFINTSGFVLRFQEPEREISIGSDFPNPSFERMGREEVIFVHYWEKGQGTPTYHFIVPKDTRSRRSPTVVESTLKPLGVQDIQTITAAVPKIIEVAQQFSATRPHPLLPQVRRGRN